MPGPVIRAYVEVEHGQVHYRTVPNTADLPPLILMHQSPLHSGIYEAALPILAEVCRPIALDTPGHGMSDPPPREWEVADYAGWMWATADALGVDRTFVFGRATGSAFGVEAALQQPERTIALITHGLALYEEEELEYRLNSDYGDPILPEADGSHLMVLWHRILGQYPFLSAPETQWNLEAYVAGGVDFGAAYRAIWRYDVRAAAIRVVAPIMLLGGTGDRIYHWFEAARLLLPDAEAAVVDGATDFVALHDPEAFAAPIRAFVTKHS